MGFCPFYFDGALTGFGIFEVQRYPRGIPGHRFRIRKNPHRPIDTMGTNNLPD
jgi:hypothetical protein